MGFKVASPFATVLKDAILAEDEASVLTNTKKETKVCLTDGLQVGKKKLSHWVCKKIIKIIPRTLSIET